MPRNADEIYAGGVMGEIPKTPSRKITDNPDDKLGPIEKELNPTQRQNDSINEMKRMDNILDAPIEKHLPVFISDKSIYIPEEKVKTVMSENQINPPGWVAPNFFSPEENLSTNRFHHFRISATLEKKDPLNNKSSPNK